MGFSLGGGISRPLEIPLLQSTHSHSIMFCAHNCRLSKKANKKPSCSPSVMAQFQDNDAAKSKRNRSVLHKRGFLLAGISAFPPLQQFRAIASEDVAKEEKETLTATEIQASGTEADNSEQVMQPRGGGSENMLLSLLNTAGVIGSGVLGALYANSQKDKTAIESTIASMNFKLGEKETAMKTLRKAYEDKMLDEHEDHRKQIERLNEKEGTISNQLASANVTITRLGKEMRSEKLSVDDLNMQIGELRDCLFAADDEKKVLQAEFKEKWDEINFLQDRVTLLGHEVQDQKARMEELDVSLSMKKSECEKLNSTLDRTKNDCENARSDVQKLTSELLQTDVELKSKNALINELNGQIEALFVEKDDMNKKVCVLQDDHNSLRLISAKKADLDSELLLKKTEELQKLEQKINQALDDAEKNNLLVSSLKKEKDGFEAKLESEIERMETLQNELKITQHGLRDSNLEVAELSTRLQESETTCKELVSELSRAQNEFLESQKLQDGDLDEARLVSLQLSAELASVKDVLEGAKQELFTTSEEFKAAIEAHESLKKELLDTYKKAETTAQASEEERKEVAKLKIELAASGEQILKDSEIITALVKDLDEAKTKKTSSPRQEMTAADLEEEKELIYKALVEQRSITKEAKENIEDAQSLINRLGTERESLQSRCVKLEEELASAKGEILRLRRLGGLKRAEPSDKHQENAC